MAVRNNQAERAVLLEEAQKAQQGQLMAQAMAMQQQAGAAPMGPPMAEEMPA
jgi:hypothetical protein